MFLSDKDKIRFFSLVGPSNKCLQWSGNRNLDGYGRISINGKALLAHRISYLIAFGSIDDSLVIDHLCKNTSCVNPLHLEQVTRGENTLRGEGCASKNKAKKKCINGHSFTEENTYLYNNGTTRKCKACTQKNNRRNFKKYKLSKQPANTGTIKGESK